MKKLLVLTMALLFSITFVSLSMKERSLPALHATGFEIEPGDGGGSSNIIPSHLYVSPTPQSIYLQNWQPTPVDPNTYWSFYNQSTTIKIGSNIYVPSGPIVYSNNYTELPGYHLFLGEVTGPQSNSSLNNQLYITFSNLYRYSNPYDFYLDGYFYKYVFLLNRHDIYRILDMSQQYVVYSMNPHYLITNNVITKWTSSYTVPNSLSTPFDTAVVHQLYVPAQILKDHLMEILIDTLIRNTNTANGINQIITSLSNQMFDKTISELISLTPLDEVKALIDFTKTFMELNSYIPDELLYIQTSDSIGRLFQAINRGDVDANSYIIFTYSTKASDPNKIFYYHMRSFTGVISPTNSYYFQARNTITQFQIPSSYYSERLLPNGVNPYGTFQTTSTNEVSTLLHNIFFSKSKHISSPFIYITG